MTFDLVALGAVALFALFGAFSGLTKQLSHLVAGLVAFLVAGPLGQLIAPEVTKAINSPSNVGTVVATIAAFVVVYVVVRIVAGLIIGRVFKGDRGSRASVDRFLGFAFGGLKTAAALWVGLSGLAFIEDNLVIAGKRYSFTPKDSVALSLARRFNFIELTQRDRAGALSSALQVARSGSAKKDDAHLKALMKDARFRQLLSSPAVKQALESSDVGALLDQPLSLDLLADPTARAHLQALAAEHD